MVMQALLALHLLYSRCVPMWFFHKNEGLNFSVPTSVLFQCLSWLQQNLARPLNRRSR